MRISHHDRRMIPGLLALGGPALLGAAIGVPSGLERMVTLAALLPLVLNGVPMLMAPALYIATTLVQAAPPASQVARAMGTSLAAYGTVLAGVAPAVAFFGATSTTPTLAVLGGMLAAGGGMLAGLRRLRQGLEFAPEVRRRALVVFAAWAVVSLALGSHLMVHLVVA